MLLYLTVSEVNKVTSSIMKTSASSLSNGKSEPVYTYSSDFIKHGTEFLFEMLVVAFQSFLIHGHLTLFLLLATLKN